jgi:hypothetical protein
LRVNLKSKTVYLRGNCESFQDNFKYDFLPYKPGALHPAASAPFKALRCFCLFGLWPKIQATRLEAVLQFVIPAKSREAGASRDPEGIDFMSISWIPDIVHLW